VYFFVELFVAFLFVFTCAIAGRLKVNYKKTSTVFLTIDKCHMHSDYKTH